MSVKCWLADDGEDGEEDARGIEAYDARDAAAKFIERSWEAIDGRLSYDVMTRDTFGVLRRFEVQVEAEPVFVAVEVRTPPPSPPIAGSAPTKGER